MFDTEKLIILEIQNFPCLWDVSSSSYNDRDIKRSCWLKVVECMYPEWENLDDKENKKKVSTKLYEYTTIYNNYKIIN
jgi:hypothetical protein